MAGRATDVVAAEVKELKHVRAEDEEEQGRDVKLQEDLGRRERTGSREQTGLEKREVDVEDGRGEERESGEDGDRESREHSPRLRDRKLEDQGADATDEKGDRRENDVAVEKDDRREDGEERQSEVERQSNPDRRERSPRPWDRMSDDRESIPQRSSGDRERSPRPWDLKPEDKEDSFIVLATNDDLCAQEEDQERMQRKKDRQERSRQMSERERLKRRSLSPRRGSRSPRRSRERSAVRPEVRYRSRSRDRGHHRQKKDQSETPQHRERSSDRGRREYQPRRAHRDRSRSLERRNSYRIEDHQARSQDTYRRSQSPLLQRRSELEGDGSQIQRPRDSSLPREQWRDTSEPRRRRRESSPHRGEGQKRAPPQSEAGGVASSLDDGGPGEISPTNRSSSKACGRDSGDEDFGEGLIPKTIPKTEAETDRVEREGRRSATEKRKRSPSRDLSPYSKRVQLTQPSRPGIEPDVRSEDGARPPRRERNGGEGQSERGERGQHPRKSRYDHWTPGDQRSRRDVRSTRDNPHPREPYDHEREASGSHEQTPDPRFRDFREEREERARQRNLKHGHHRGEGHKDSRGQGRREDRRDSRGYGGHEHRRDSRDHGGRDVIPQHQHHHRDSYHQDYNHQPASHPKTHRTTYPSQNPIPYPAWGHQHPPLPPPRYRINDHVRLRTPMTQTEKDYYQPTPGKIRYHKLWDKERPLRSGLYRVVERRYREADLGVLWEYKVKAVKETEERKGGSYEEREKRAWEDGRLEGVWFGENEVIDRAG